MVICRTPNEVDVLCCFRTRFIPDFASNTLSHTVRVFPLLESGVYSAGAREGGTFPNIVFITFVFDVFAWVWDPFLHHSKCFSAALLGFTEYFSVRPFLDNILKICSAMSFGKGFRHELRKRIPAEKFW